MIRDRGVALTAHQVTLRYLRDMARDLGCEARGAAMRGETETQAIRIQQQERIAAALEIVEGRKP